MRQMLMVMVCAAAMEAEPATPPVSTVEIKNFHFVPDTLKIPAGATVTWTNKDDDVHTVMSASGLFVSGALDTGDHYSYQFTKPGTYQLACSLHPQMSQTIVVEQAVRVSQSKVNSPGALPAAGASRANAHHDPTIVPATARRRNRVRQFTAARENFSSRL